MSNFDQVCCYCGEPKGEKISCCGDVHFEDQLCEWCEERPATVMAHDEDSCKAHGLDNAHVCQQCLEREVDRQNERHAEDERNYAAELKSDHFHSRRMGAWE